MMAEAAHKHWSAQVAEAAATILSSWRGVALPSIAVIAGSGLGEFTEMLTIEREMPYAQIPFMPTTHVVGHKGSLILAKVPGSSRRVLVLSGRAHSYEGEQIAGVDTTNIVDRSVFATRLMIRLGVRTLIVSNAAGGLNATFEVDDLMVIRDIINWTGRNPLIGPNDDRVGPRFPDMSQPFDRALGDLAIRVGMEQGIPLREGVYLANRGPAYETRAEVRMLRFLGADVVGMSTIFEVLVARHAGLRVLGMTLVSNSLVTDAKPTHDEVAESGKRVAKKFGTLVRSIVDALPAEEK